METILEEQRRFNEERERLVDVMTKEILRKKSSVFLFSNNKLFSFNSFFVNEES